MSGMDNTSETFRISAGSTTLNQNDYVLLILGATGAVTVTLPLAAAVQPGRCYQVYKDAAAQTITLTASGSDTINGGALTLASGAKHSTTLMSDGVSVWYPIDGY